MSPSTCFFVLLFSLFACLGLTATDQPPKVHPVVHRPNQNQARTGFISPEVISKACEPSTKKAFCVSVLKSRTVSDINDMKEATLVALQAASSEAVATSEFIKKMRQKIDDNDGIVDSWEEQAMADCSESYINIVEMLADATSALLTGPESDVKVEIEAAITTADTCGKSVNRGKKTGELEEVAKKNENVKKFCSNALSIYNVYANGH